MKHHSKNLDWGIFHESKGTLLGLRPIGFRVLDLIFATAMCVLLAPMITVVALLILLCLGRPIIFSQERVGGDQRPFKLYKFRTLSHEVDNTHSNHMNSVPTLHWLLRFLRELKLDELPQLINVLKGNMSLVGPRPEQRDIVNVLRQRFPNYNDRSLVKPGITGWAQINDPYARALDDAENKLKWDLYYIRHQSFGFYCYIVLRTTLLLTIQLPLQQIRQRIKLL